MQQVKKEGQTKIRSSPSNDLR